MKCGYNNRKCNIVHNVSTKAAVTRIPGVCNNVRVYLTLCKYISRHVKITNILSVMITDTARVFLKLLLESD